MQLVYGPTPSRRYGRTLGINLLGSQKVCSYDCVYCSLGPTQMTMNAVRKTYQFPSLADLTTQFKSYIKASVAIDHIVVSGNGEPTLYPEFDLAMRTLIELRDEHLPQTKIVVLTNGAHLDNKKVAAGLNLADECVVKIDAGNDPLFHRVNAPLVRLNLSRFLTGLNRLNAPVVQSLFTQGEIDNTLPEAVDDWIEVLGMIKPRAVQICTLEKPAPLYPSLRAPDEDTLYSIAFRLKKRTGLEANVFGGRAVKTA